MTYQPRLITPCVVTYDTVVQYVDTRTRWQKFKDTITLEDPPPLEKLEYRGRTQISQCVIDFGPYPQKLGVKIKEPIAFDYDEFDVLQTTYYGVIPLRIDSSGNHVCIIDQFSKRNILIDDSGEEP